MNELHTTEYRVGVTGSRTWVNECMLHEALREIYFHDVQPYKGWVMTVVHGHCPTGADAMADEWVQRMERQGYAVQFERHPANWKEHGIIAAGFIRNAEMVDDPRSYDRWLAFVMPCTREGQCYRRGKPWPKPHDTHGTADTIERIEAHHFPLMRFTDEAKTAK